MDQVDQQRVFASCYMLIHRNNNKHSCERTQNDRPPLSTTSLPGPPNSLPTSSILSSLEYLVRFSRPFVEIRRRCAHVDCDLDCGRRWKIYHYSYNCTVGMMELDDSETQYQYSGTLVPGISRKCRFGTVPRTPVQSRTTGSTTIYTRRVRAALGDLWIH